MYRPIGGYRRLWHRKSRIFFLNSGSHTAATTNRNTEGTKVCRYSWHSAGPGLAISSAKTFEYIFQIKYIRTQFYRTVLGNCYGLKLQKCRWQFKNAFIVSFIIIIFGTFSLTMCRPFATGNRYT